MRQNIRLLLSTVLSLVAESYKQLKLNTEDMSQVKCFQLALGACTKEGVMISEGTSTMNHLLDESEATDIGARNMEAVKRFDSR